MSKFIKILFVFGVLALVAVNIFLFGRSVVVGQEIHGFEKKIASLQKENSRFEAEIYKMQSHTKSASIASELSFGKFNTTLYSTQPKYALK